MTLVSTVMEPRHTVLTCKKRPISRTSRRADAAGELSLPAPVRREAGPGRNQMSSLSGSCPGAVASRPGGHRQTPLGTREAHTPTSSTCIHRRPRRGLSVMKCLEQVWVTSGIAPIRRVPGEPGVRARVYADVLRPGTEPL
ncbi:DUF6207 family protein [Streptomyces sp. NPDC047718]|uniref:DUF6207 family protein n=1 Tax=Streptomyces sp. NPDC047718 TaxID=3155479 RepID=UPI0033EF5DED